MAEAVDHPAHYGGADNGSAQVFGRPRIEIGGQRFGMLVAIERIADPDTGHLKLWRCACDCGREKIASTGTLRAGKQKSCGCRPRSGKFSGRWKGGRLVTGAGYVRLHAPEHPRANACGQVLEHHVVMEKRIGRYLHPDEEVHHRNGIRSDNTDANLELWTKSHPAGVRAADLYAWAKAFIARYEGEIE